MGKWIVELVGELGYAGIALLTFLENIFPPIPSELIMPLAGFHAATGAMTFWGAVTAGSLGSLAGTCFWYWLGLRVGERRLCSWIERHGRWLSVEPHDLDRANAWFARHGKAAVFMGRMVPGLRTVISLPAGFTRMPLGAFLIPSAIGTALWTAGLTYAGWMLGENHDAVEGVVGWVSISILIVVVVLYVWRQVRAAFRRPRHEDQA